MPLSIPRQLLTSTAWHDMRLRAAPAIPYALAIIVGVGAGAAAIVFAELIELADWLFFEQLGGALDPLGDWRYILIPAAGGLIVGPIVYFFASEARGHGVPEVMAAVETRGGRIRYRVAGAKAVASAITIGSGGSAGREGPVVQIASGIGSSIGQIARMSDENVRVLVAAGAAGGIAATFNAPLAGVFFALEVILRNFNVRNFGIVVLSAVVAAALSHGYFGDNPAFRVSEYKLESPVEFPLYALLGVLAALAAVAFIWTLNRTEGAFERAPVPGWVKPALGGLGVGLIGVWYLDVFGSGYGSGPGQDAIPLALTGDRETSVLALLAGLKIVATSLTLGSGGSGGVFAPALFIGAMVGGAFGALAGEVFPDSTAPSGAYASVGMAAVFAGAARAPITAVLILFEMTRDYSIILPLMTSVVVAVVIAQLIHRDSIYTIKLKEKGIHIEERRRPDPVLASLTVGQAMSRNFEVIRHDMLAKDLLQAYSERGLGDDVLPVLDGNRRLVGIVTARDVQRALEGDIEDLTALDIASRNVVSAYPDQALDEAMQVMSSGSLRQLPVVARGRNPVVLGVLTRADIFTAYGSATGERTPGRRYSPLAGIEGYGTQVLEVELTTESALIGKTLKEIKLPTEGVIVSIIRDGAMVVPRGDTQVATGDRLIAVVTPAARSELEAALTAQRLTDGAGSG